MLTLSGCCEAMTRSQVAAAIAADTRVSMHRRPYASAQLPQAQTQRSCPNSARPTLSGGWEAITRSQVAAAIAADTGVSMPGTDGHMPALSFPKHKHNGVALTLQGPPCQAAGRPSHAAKWQQPSQQTQGSPCRAQTATCQSCAAGTAFAGLAAFPLWMHSAQASAASHCTARAHFSSTMSSRLLAGAESGAM